MAEKQQAGELPAATPTAIPDGARTASGHGIFVNGGKELRIVNGE
jgi:hypothetical protein